MLEQMVKQPGSKSLSKEASKQGSKTEAVPVPVPQERLSHQPDQRRVTLRATTGTLAGWTKITTHPSSLTPPADQSTEDRT